MTIPPICRAALTRRELSVAELLVHGLPEREIAQRLGIKMSTLKQALRHMYDRFGVNSGIKRVQLVRMLLCV